MNRKRMQSPARELLFPSIYDGALVLRAQRRYHGAYVVREEVVPCEPESNMGMLMQIAYTPEGYYIGNPKIAHNRYVKRGLSQLDKIKSTSRTCSLGFSAAEQKWYGWSHRAICGFGIGDRLFVERYGDDKTPFTRHGPMPITTLAEAKIAARRFAASVS
jgi:hypothetical protein